MELHAEKGGSLCRERCGSEAGSHNLVKQRTETKKDANQELALFCLHLLCWGYTLTGDGTYMKLQKLSKIDALLIYKTHLPRDFHAQEIKPLDEVSRLVEAGLYHGYGLYDGDELVAYAFLCHPLRGECLLLDFYAVRPAYRDKGYGTLFIKLLKEAFSRIAAGIMIEVESPESALDDAERNRCERRIAFYKRCGMRETGIETALSGSTYFVMYLPCNEDTNDSRILSELTDIYADLFCEDIYGHKLRAVSVGA